MNIWRKSEFIDDLGDLKVTEDKKDPLIHTVRYTLVNKLLEVHETDTLVDIGCGGGGRIDALSRSCFCVGTDDSEKMCRTTRKRATQSEVVRVDMERIPLKDASVDKVAAVYSLVYASDKRLVFHEISRILKNNGVIGRIRTEQMEYANGVPLPPAYNPRSPRQDEPCQIHPPHGSDDAFPQLF